MTGIKHLALSKVSIPSNLRNVPMNLLGELLEKLRVKGW
jgi:hypothetical protein